MYTNRFELISSSVFFFFLLSFGGTYIYNLSAASASTVAENYEITDMIDAQLCGNLTSPQALLDRKLCDDASNVPYLRMRELRLLRRWCREWLDGKWEDDERLTHKLVHINQSFCFLLSTSTNGTRAC